MVGNSGTVTLNLIAFRVCTSTVSPRQTARPSHKQWKLSRLFSRKLHRRRGRGGAVPDSASVCAARAEIAHFCKHSSDSARCHRVRPWTPARLSEGTRLCPHLDLGPATPGSRISRASAAAERQLDDHASLPVTQAPCNAELQQGGLPCHRRTNLGALASYLQNHAELSGQKQLAR